MFKKTQIFCGSGKMQVIAMYYIVLKNIFLSSSHCFKRFVTGVIENAIIIYKALVKYSNHNCGKIILLQIFLDFEI
jgi:hypothetical protein